MTKILVTLLASSALCASLPLRAQAELDVAWAMTAKESSRRNGTLASYEGG